MEYNPVQSNQMPVGQKFVNLLWYIVNTTVFRIIPPYTSLCKKVKILILRIFGAKIAWTANVSSSANIEYPWNLTLGHLSSLGAKSWIYAVNTILIGEKTCIGKGVYLITGSHDVNKSTFDLVTKPIIIHNNVWIATDARVFQGITIGEGAVIGACATVFKDVEPYTVVGGNPAKFIKEREIKE